MTERLKNGGTILTKDYFKEQLERIREIRLSERRFYQKITDIYATSIDYDAKAETTRLIFRTGAESAPLGNSRRNGGGDHLSPCRQQQRAHGADHLEGCPQRQNSEIRCSDCQELSDTGRAFCDGENRQRLS